MGLCLVEWGLPKLVCVVDGAVFREWGLPWLVCVVDGAQFRGVGITLAGLCS